MSLCLILVRHAKSSWNDESQSDHSRPLNGRGQRSATALGQWLAERGYLPDLVLCSDAVRTRETWAGIAAQLSCTTGNDGPRVEFDASLYLASPDTLLASLQRAGTAPKLLLLGHNPGVAVTARQLASAPAFHDDFHRYPTAATTVFDVNVDAWSSLAWGTAAVRDFVVPRDN